MTFHFSQPRDGAPVACSCSIGHDHDVEDSSQNFVIIGVDPGESMGVAVLTSEQERTPELLTVFQGIPHDGMTLVRLIIERYHPTAKVTIACERFIQMGGRRTHQPTAQRVGGALEQLAKDTGVEFAWQGPADARAVASNDILRQLHMLHITWGKDADDANMAVRHALLYMARTHATYFDALLRYHHVRST